MKQLKKFEGADCLENCNLFFEAAKGFKLYSYEYTCGLQKAPDFFEELSFDDFEKVDKNLSHVLILIDNPWGPELRQQYREEFLREYIKYCCFDVPLRSYSNFPDNIETTMFECNRDKNLDNKTLRKMIKQYHVLLNDMYSILDKHFILLSDPLITPRSVIEDSIKITHTYCQKDFCDGVRLQDWWELIIASREPVDISPSWDRPATELSNMTSSLQNKFHDPFVLSKPSLSDDLIWVTS